MNAEYILNQLSDKIFNGGAGDQVHALNSQNNCPPEISDLISLSLKNDIPPADIMGEALDKPMLASIEDYKKDDVLFLELMERATLARQARDRLADHLEDPESLSKGTLLLATVKGEYHRHGKDIISTLSRGIGFNTIDIGMGIPAGDILDAAEEHQPDYIGISASTRATIPDLKGLLDKMNTDRVFVNTRVILGGMLAGDDEADALDADYRCPNFDQAIHLLVSLANASN